MRAECAKKIINFSPPDISEAEITEVAETLRSGWITTGPRTKLLERRLAAYIETGQTDIDRSAQDEIEKYGNRVVCLNSATAAEELNLRILGIGPGDEILVPAYTYTATASAAIHVGATVRFIDSQKDSYEMDYDQMEDAITENTKAIISVDLGGVISNYDRILQAVENKRHLFTLGGNTELGKRIQKTLGRVAIVADCAHALGAVRQGRHAGAIADFSSFSFHAVKNFTTAEGGAATWRPVPGIDNEEIYRQYQLYSLHGQSKDALAKTSLGAWEYDIIGPWYKCNMTDVMAAIGLKQLDRYPELLKRRREIIEKYDEMCKRLSVEYLTHYGRNFASSGHLYLMRIPGLTEHGRNEFITEMAGHGVACNVHYKPLPMMTAYKKNKSVADGGADIRDYPNAYRLYENEITLPLHTKLTDEDVGYVIRILEETVRNMKNYRSLQTYGYLRGGGTLISPNP